MGKDVKNKYQHIVEEAQKKLDSFKIDDLKKNGFFTKDDQYFPSIFYPPIPLCPPSNEQKVFSTLKTDDDTPLSLYFHIPFCPSRCVYCHWTVSVGNKESEMERYVDALRTEIQLYKKRLKTDVISPRSILIGGGTPTMLSARLLEKLFGIIHSELDLSLCTQITCEAEPTTVLNDDGFAKLKVLKANNVKRISFGSQVLDDATLKKMGRFHTADDVYKAIDQTRAAGIETISLDLIYGYPDHTFDKWAQTLDLAFSLNIDACQVYRLRIVPHGDKPGNINKIYKNNPEIFPNVNDVFLMKEFGILYARERGFFETSRRVFAKDPKHNSDYLKDHNDRLADVMGLGISSWSNFQGHLSINTSESFEAYYSLLDKGTIPINRGTIRSQDDTNRWALVLPLKHNGIVKEYYKKVTGQNVTDVFGNKIKRLKEFGLIEETDKMISLTEKGKFFADEVMIQFYKAEYIPFPKELYVEGKLNPYNVF